MSMIDFKEHTLANGLRVVVHRDRSSQMAAVNVLYRVGARNESPARTGFAHLFEHLMFRGTESVPDFDVPVQMACGENNAFTNNDYTDYYITLPKGNVETALWLESDRMTGLDISPEKLEAEKRVVIEEYNQRYLNQPYGEQWLLLRPLVYKSHPYRWPTIGMTPDHIASATMDDVRRFYDRFYNPSNAILSIAADMEPERMVAMAEEWFGDLEGRPVPCDALPSEPEQTSARRREIVRDVPATMLTVAFKTGRRTDRVHYVCDVMTDLLAGGTSARLYQRLVKERKIFSGIDAFASGDMDTGMVVVTGQLADGVGLSAAEEAVWGQLRLLGAEPACQREMEKVRNKFEAETEFGELNVMNKAMNLGFYAMLGDTGLVNREVDIYRSVSADEIAGYASRLFAENRSSTLIIRSENDKE